MSPIHASRVRAALRISCRNALRSKRRSTLILAMIGLPVALAVLALTALFPAAGTDRLRAGCPPLPAKRWCPPSG